MASQESLLRGREVTLPHVTFRETEEEIINGPLRIRARRGIAEVINPATANSVTSLISNFRGWQHCCGIKEQSPAAQGSEFCFGLLGLLVCLFLRQDLAV